MFKAALTRLCHDGVTVTSNVSIRSNSIALLINRQQTLQFIKYKHYEISATLNVHRNASL